MATVPTRCYKGEWTLNTEPPEGPVEVREKGLNYLNGISMPNSEILSHGPCPNEGSKRRLPQDQWSWVSPILRIQDYWDSISQRRDEASREKAKFMWYLLWPDPEEHHMRKAYRTYPHSLLINKGHQSALQRGMLSHSHQPLHPVLPSSNYGPNSLLFLHCMPWGLGFGEAP